MGGFCRLKYLQKLTENTERDLNNFLKQPATPRIKEKTSLIDKAFHRKEKSYNNPYQEIEDKVGIRFVVLLTSDIDEVCEIIKIVINGFIRHQDTTKKKD